MKGEKERYKKEMNTKTYVNQKNFGNYKFKERERKGTVKRNKREGNNVCVWVSMFERKLWKEAIKE